MSDTIPSESTNVCEAFNVCPCVGVIFEIITLPDGASATFTTAEVFALLTEVLIPYESI